MATGVAFVALSISSYAGLPIGMLAAFRHTPWMIGQQFAEPRWVAGILGHLLLRKLGTRFGGPFICMNWREGRWCGSP